MTNSSSLFKAGALGIGALLLIIVDGAALGLDLYGNGMSLAMHLAAALCLLGSGSLFLRVEKALRRIASVCEAAACGDLEARVMGVREPGLLGVLHRNVNHLLDVSDAFVREASGSMRAVSQGRYYRKVLTHGLPGTYATAAQNLNRATEVMEARVRAFARFAQQNVSIVMASVAAAAAEMRASAEAMSGTAEDSNTLATSVAAAAEQATANVQTVATAANALAASLGEIGSQVIHSSRMARNAAEQAEQTNATVASLSEAASRIGEIVQMIDAIAEQTNLLALNATIEAARAGEAGKGFAVVAGEVKTLAGQTARATEEIASQIGAIQAATREAVEAIKGIGVTIQEVNAISATITGAVERQGVTSQEIARNVTEAATGTGEVSRSIVGVSEAATATGGAAAQVLEAAAELSQQAERLKTEIDEFLTMGQAA